MKLNIPKLQPGRGTSCGDVCLRRVCAKSGSEPGQLGAAPRKNANRLQFDVPAPAVGRGDTQMMLLGLADRCCWLRPSCPGL